MTDCSRIEAKHSETAAPPPLPESCNSLVSLSESRSTPVLHRRSEAVPDSPGTDSKNTVAIVSSSYLPDAPAPCDPCRDVPIKAKAAEHVGAFDKSKFWFNAGLLSYHPTDHIHQFNDLNYGFGIEYEKSPKVVFAVGEYRNSVRHNSYYGMVEYKPLHLGPVRAGIAGGTISGYPEMNHGNFFPAALPIASVEGKHFGANFIYIPNVVKGVEPALSTQLKFRF